MVHIATGDPGNGFCAFIDYGSNSNDDRNFINGIRHLPDEGVGITFATVIMLSDQINKISTFS